MFNYLTFSDKLFKSSFYAKFIIEKYPNYFNNIENDDFLKKYFNIPIDKYHDFLLEKYPDIKNITDYKELFIRLRQIKNIEMILIGILDFSKKLSFENIVLLTSKLADFCIDFSIKNAFLKLNNNNQINIKYLQENIIILGMGKLGGNELNFSSDIDLIFFCSNELAHNSEMLNETNLIIKNILDILRINSSEGFLYRVDLRLRPEGNVGPLVMSIKNALEYYHNRGKNWEFQAMIKSRLVWGNIKIFKEFQKELNPLIYSHKEPEKILESIKEIKDDIEKKVSDKNNQINIKLAPGGIRDIEFIIQFLQLIHGIRYKEIRKSNSLEALLSLKIFNIISQEEYKILHNNYIILRKVENILQLNDNLAVQTIPDDINEIERLFVYWEIENLIFKTDFGNNFKNAIKKRMSEVRKIFTSLFDETIRYINLKNNLIEKYNDISKELIENHFYRMDSEYFLRFDEKEIVDHIRMISKLNYTNLTNLKIIPINNNILYLTIVAFDYCYEFSKIAGLLSVNYLEILEGESFTYCDYDENLYKKTNNFFYRRQRKRIYLDSNFFTDEKGLIKKRKIVCVTKVKPLFKDKDCDWEKFNKDLNSLLILLEKNNEKEAEKILNLKIFEIFKKLPKKITNQITPVEIEVDNSSSNQYTILQIKSKDSFAFLYTYTNILAMRDYYISKVEIKTIKGYAIDRLFIMTRDGNKITSQEKLKELEITILMIKQYSALLYNAIDPNKALDYFNKLLERIFESGEKNELPILGQKDVLEKLAKVFGISDFIWEDLFRLNHQNLLPLLKDEIINAYNNKSMLYQIFTEKYCNNMNYLELDINNFEKKINTFKDEESFRIDLRQIFKKIDMFQFSLELTTLAEVVIEITLNKIEKELSQKNNISNLPPWAVFGLGKLGGKELGFASDIELMFIYEIKNDQNNNYNVIFEKMIHHFLKIIHAKREGIFQIDLNLRPYGDKGTLAVSLNNFKKYFSDTGDAYFFERQALTKLRFITSNLSGSYLKNEVEKSTQDFVYSKKPIEIDSLYKIRKMQLDNYVKLNTINIKFSSGGLVDIEYMVQVIQIFYGSEIHSIRKNSTIDAIEALFHKKIINEQFYKDLKESYIFYRNLINILRMVRGNAKDLAIYDEDSIEYEFLVKRSYFINIIDEESNVLLKNKIDKHINIIKNYFENLRDLLKI